MAESPAVPEVEQPQQVPSAPRAWIVRAQGDRQKYKGNLGYADVLGARYCYDSFVANCKQIDIGHILVLWDNPSVKAVAQVRDIDSWPGTKDRRACPKCGRPSIDELKSRGHFVCRDEGCKATFNEPAHKKVRCTLYSAEYEGAVVPLSPETSLTPQMIEEASPRFNRQNSIVPIDLARIQTPDWQAVADAIRRLLQLPRAAADNRTWREPTADEQIVWEEGRILFVRHKRRERRPGLVKRKKAQARRGPTGLACEACDFDFAKSTANWVRGSRSVITARRWRNSAARRRRRSRIWPSCVGTATGFYTALGAGTCRWSSCERWWSSAGRRERGMAAMSSEPRHFLLYWRPATADEVLAGGGPCRYAASNQFSRLKKGDVVWPVTCREGSLRLVACVVVGEVVGRAEAQRRLGMPDIWKAERYALAEPGTEAVAREVEIDGIAERLRFVSAGGNDRLALTDGKVNQQELQTMRQVSDGSVPLLEEMWAGKR